MIGESRMISLQVWKSNGARIQLTVLPSHMAKLPRLFSRFWNPGKSGIVFFAQELSSENCLVVPPVSLVARVSPIMAFVQFLASSDEQISVVH